MAEQLARYGYELSDPHFLMTEPIELEFNPEWHDRNARAAYERIVPMVEAISRITYRAAGDYDERHVGQHTASHMRRVGRLSYEFAQDFFRHHDTAVYEWAFVAGLAHDVGKLPIGEEDPYLLDFTYKYTDEDRKRMESHPRVGSQLLLSQADSNLIVPALVAELHHHAKPVEISKPASLSGPHRLLLKEARQQHPALNEDVLRQLIVAVSTADVLDAVLTRAYVEDSARPQGTDPRSWAEWFNSHLDATVLEVPLWQRKQVISSLRRTIGHYVISF